MDLSCLALRGLSEPLLVLNTVPQNKYQAALQRLRSDPTWLGMDPAKRQEAFESLWGQYSIKQWQARKRLRQYVDATTDGPAHRLQRQ